MLEPFTYASLDHPCQSLSGCVIAPAVEKAQALRPGMGAGYALDTAQERIVGDSVILP